MSIEIRNIVAEESQKVHDLLVSDYYRDCLPIPNFHLDMTNINVGGFDGDELIGFTDIGYLDFNLASLYFNDPSAITAAWFSVVVRKDYRGNGLQRRLYEYAEQQLPARIKYVDVTAHYSNIPSITNIMKLGFRHIGRYSMVCNKFNIVLDHQHPTFNFEYFIKKIN